MISTVVFDLQSHRPTLFMRLHTPRSKRDRGFTRKLAKTSFDETLDLAAEVSFKFKFCMKIHTKYIRWSVRRFIRFSQPESHLRRRRCRPVYLRVQGSILSPVLHRYVFGSSHTSPSSRSFVSAGLHLPPSARYQRVPDRVSQEKAGEEAFRPGYAGDQGPQGTAGGTERCTF